MGAHQLVGLVTQSGLAKAFAHAADDAGHGNVQVSDILHGPVSYTHLDVYKRQGDWPAQYFYYAGGVPRIMEEIKSMLHLDAKTVTGKTLGCLLYTSRCV